jgi:hypothetical protein
MSDDLCEEQEMEAEALAAIFDDCLEIISSTQPFEWAVDLWPEQHTVEDEDDNDPDAPQNHVGIKVTAKIPLSYPDESLPEFNIKILKGLTEEHEQELLELAMEEAENNRGMPVMYTVCERLREWLLENNQKGMDDRSMYTQMIKREKEKEREEVSSNNIIVWIGFQLQCVCLCVFVCAVRSLGLSRRMYFGVIVLVYTMIKDKTKKRPNYIQYVYGIWYLRYNKGFFFA